MIKEKPSKVNGEAVSLGDLVTTGGFLVGLSCLALSRRLDLCLSLFRPLSCSAPNARHP